MFHVVLESIKACNLAVAFVDPVVTNQQCHTTSNPFLRNRNFTNRTRIPINEERDN
jgi:hypothetical protein